MANTNIAWNSKFWKIKASITFSVWFWPIQPQAQEILRCWYGVGSVIACPGGQPERAYTDGAGGMAVRLARITLPEAPCQHRKQNFRASHRKNDWPQFLQKYTWQTLARFVRISSNWAFVQCIYLQKRFYWRRVPRNWSLPYDKLSTKTQESICQDQYGNGGQKEINIIFLAENLGS